MYYNFLFTLISVFVMPDPIFPCSCDDEMSVAEVDSTQDDEGNIIETYKCIFRESLESKN
jgi:hypothetical protein